VSNLGEQMVEARERGLVDQVLVLSRYHARTLPVRAQPWISVLPNAMTETFFNDGPNEWSEFIYASAPNRGLEELLKVWPALRSALGATTRLRVYYGFSSSFLKWGRDNHAGGQHAFETWVAAMRSKLDALRDDGVEYVGMVDQEELSRAYARAGFFVYPTSFSETGCIALMKAMAMGAIPITSRLAASTLPELAGEWDLGPPADTPDGRVSPPRNDPAFLAHYIDAVLSAARRARAGALDDLRGRMKRWARSELLWKASARKLLQAANL
jgi:glycosyltransferase involved in cell wall biosynthesis